MNQRRIVILGFMACGKTTVGQELARQLNCNFVDLDSFITEREGRSPAEIIEQDGEAAFREVETLVLPDVLSNRQTEVIALGGGTWLIPANRTLIALYDCVTVWLDAPFQLCWERIDAGSAVRPLAPDRDTARAHYDSRCAHYALAAHRFSVSESDTPEMLAAQILRET